MSLTTSPLDELIRRIRDKAAWDAPAARGAHDELGDGGPMRLAASGPVEGQVRRPLARMHVRDFYLIDDNEAFVRFAYHSLLGRAADMDGFEATCQRLAQGGSRAGVVCSLRLSGEGKVAAVQVDGLQLAWIAWTVERLLRAVGLKSTARRLSVDIDQWITGNSAQHAEESLARTGADLAVLRFIESWRAPLESHAGRTAVLEREVKILRDTVHELSTSVQQLRGELHYARHVTANASASANAAHSSGNMPTDGRTSEVNSTTVSNVPTSHTATSHKPINNADLDAYYVAFEDANRGTHQAFIDKLSVYKGVFETLQQPGRGPLLDIGCGRGELLDHLKGMGITARGVDLNAVMVALCRERGHDVAQGDALAILKSLPDDSLAAVSGFHIIEHLPFEICFELVRECRRVLQPEGFILFETPNPENVLVGSHTFYHDFTHRNPVTPTALQFLAQYHGFAELQIIRSSPYPDSAKVPGDDPLTRRVNGHFCGPQDFALLARKPAAAKHSRQA